MFFLQLDSRCLDFRFSFDRPPHFQNLGSAGNDAVRKKTTTHLPAFQSCSWQKLALVHSSTSAGSTTRQPSNADGSCPLKCNIRAGTADRQRQRSFLLTPWRHSICLWTPQNCLLPAASSWHHQTTKLSRNAIRSNIPVHFQKKVVPHLARITHWKPCFDSGSSFPRNNQVTAIKCRKVSGQWAHILEFHQLSNNESLPIVIANAYQARFAAWKLTVVQRLSQLPMTSTLYLLWSLPLAHILAFGNSKGPMCKGSENCSNL